MIRHLLFLFSLATLMGSCGQSDEFNLRIPANFPAPEIPEENALTQLRVELGQQLFFDPILSVDTSISCSSCHKPDFAFADTIALSIGVHGHEGSRNSPSLINIAYHPLLMRDGGVPTLEMQVFAPVLDESEMGFNMRLLAERLENHPRYGRMMQKAYGRRDSYAITRALAAYQRTLIQGNSRYDSNKLTSSEIRGQEIFDLHCSSCHSGFNFTNYELVNIGLRESYHPDSGYARITLKAEDSGKFKVPGLRNVKLTAPYMHDGSYRTLEEVVAFFNSGGVGHRNQDSRIKPLGLTEAEMEDLVDFLEAL